MCGGVGCGCKYFLLWVFFGLLGVAVEGRDGDGRRGGEGHGDGNCGEES